MSSEMTIEYEPIMPENGSKKGPIWEVTAFYDVPIVRQHAITGVQPPLKFIQYFSRRNFSYQTMGRRKVHLSNHSPPVVKQYWTQVAGIGHNKALGRVHYPFANITSNTQ
jgi:hypothetical protein